MSADPTCRACLDYAHRVVNGFCAGDEQYVCRDGITIATQHGVERIELCGDDDGALIHLVAKSMELHLSGVNFQKVRDDLLASGLGLLADKVYDHLVDVSVMEWQRLRERVAFYVLDDNTHIIVPPTKNAGAS